MAAILIDDTDASLQYSSSPSWYHAGTPSEYKSTTHGADKAGAQATLTFNGTSVAVYGTIAQQTESTYSIDGADPIVYHTQFQDPALFRQLFFQSPKLNDGPHVLVITNTLSVSPNAFWLDYFEVVPSLPTSSSVSPSTASTASASNPSSGSSSAPPPSRSHALIGAIVGGVIAGLIAIAVLLFFYWRWRKKTRAVSLGKRKAFTSEFEPLGQPYPGSNGAGSYYSGNNTHQGAAPQRTWGSEERRVVHHNGQILLSHDAGGLTSLGYTTRGSAPREKSEGLSRTTTAFSRPPPPPVLNDGISGVPGHHIRAGNVSEPTRDGIAPGNGGIAEDTPPPYRYTTQMRNGDPQLPVHQT